MAQSAQYSLTIEAGTSGRHYWSDLWRYRELFYFLSWRDVLVRYKQTVIGLAWSVLRPLLTMVVFTVIFGKFMKLPSEGAPYPVLVFAALLPWQLFSGSLMDCSNSVLANSALVSKVYFPRMIIPASTVIVNLIDFGLSLLILSAMMVIYGFAPSWRLAVLPGLLLLAVMAALGIGLWIAALNVRYRDFKYVVPFMVQLGMYISPIGFSSGIIPEKWRLIYSINPLVGVIDGFRWAILRGGTHLYWPGFALSVTLTVIMLALGIRYFRNVERTFADVI